MKRAWDRVKTWGLVEFVLVGVFFAGLLSPFTLHNSHAVTDSDMWLRLIGAVYAVLASAVLLLTERRYTLRRAMSWGALAAALWMFVFVAPIPVFWFLFGVGCLMQSRAERLAGESGE